MSRDQPRYLIIPILLTVLLFSAPVDATGQIGSTPSLAPKPTIILLGLEETDTVDACGQWCFTWLPAKNAEQAARIWSQGGRWRSLSFASIGGSSDSGAAFVDLVSDYLGPARLTLAGTVAASSGADEADDVQRFLTGGGSASLHLALAGPTLMWGSESYLMLLATPRVGFDFPALGARTDDSSGNIDLGLEARLHHVLANGTIGLLAQVRFSRTIGGEQFYDGIGLDEAQQEAFNYLRVNAGLTFPELGFGVLWSSVPDGPTPLRESWSGHEIAVVLFR